MKASFIIFVIFALAICAAEEIETRKIVKKSSAVDNKSTSELRTEVPETETIAVALIKETTSPSDATTITSASTTILPVPDVAASSSTVEPFTVISTTTENTQVEDLSAELSAVNFPAQSLMTEPNSESSTSLPDSLLQIPDDGGLDVVSPPEMNNIIPLGHNPKRKVVYINQQQNGKLNVQLELSDVSVIVIPNQRDPQMSLLNILFKSAQKSNEVKTKEENELNEQYSKYKLPVRPTEDIYNFGANNAALVESRAPYKVDISSTMGQQSHPAVDIMPNGHQHLIPQQQFQPQFARSPIMQLLKPIPFAIHPAPGQLPQSNRIFKRSTGSRMLITDDGIPGDGENSVNEELTESIFNNFDHDDDLNGFAESDRSEFVLLGATENCGPGRKRNSYQICVSDPNWESDWESGWEWNVTSSSISPYLIGANKKTEQKILRVSNLKIGSRGSAAMNFWSQKRNRFEMVDGKKEKTIVINNGAFVQNKHTLILFTSFSCENMKKSIVATNLAVEWWLSSA